jgi:diguanylate cyclase (GGDEF)-like protein
VAHLDTASQTPVLLRFVHSIPWYVWLIVALALLLAALAAAGAMRARMLARRQELALAAVTAEALVDPLTGVLNRRGFIDAAERELARAQRYGRPFALAYADVKGLKVVNDTQGHLAGDQLIRQATALLEDSARADDVVGRLGGDEFGVLLVEQTQEGAAAVTSRIRERLPARRARLGLEVPWDLTIGTAAFPEDGGDVEELLRAADRRLYEQRGITLS